jgi:outer membrane protein OmpU
MKHILAATALLALTSGFAAAEITMSGDARMGIIGFDDEVYFTHRARVKFTLSGESDSGFSFGASFRAGNAFEAAGLSKGSAGEVFISGAFGTLTMGDIDNAAQAIVGQVDGVGLTGLGDLNEIVFVGDVSPSLRYDYASGAWAFSASVGQNRWPYGYAVGVSYSMDGYKFSAGYEQGSAEVSALWAGSYYIEDQVTLGADATFGNVTMKLRYADGSGWETFGPSYNGEIQQLAVSATYSMDALSLTAFATQIDLEGPEHNSDINRYGIGASYDLGGGAALKAGYAASTHDSCLGLAPVVCTDRESDEWDLGLSFEF